MFTSRGSESDLVLFVERACELLCVARLSRRATEPQYVEKCGDELWIAEKFQSNSEIAGSPRNSFRASLVGKITGGRALNG